VTLGATVVAGGGVRVTARLVALVASLRAGGVRAGVGELVAAHRALAAVDGASRQEAYFALRAALCSRREDLESFDAAFAAWFDAYAHRPEPPVDLDAARLVLPRVAVPGASPPEPGAPDLVPVPAAWSDVELLREKDFATYTDAERLMARRLMARLAARGPRRVSRRTRPSRRRGPHPPGARHDLRRTLRDSLRYGGEPVERRWREPSLRQRPLVMVCDVSGSMEPYARMLLQYMHACVAARRRVEAFAFGTRLTRLTRELAGRDHDRALGRAHGAAADWSGGTRIGACLSELNREHGRRIGRGAVVVVLSDGWDRGDPEQLAREMERLGRCAHRLVWLNPLKASAGYEPLTRGMAAALPHVDDFLAGNSLASLEELAELLEGEPDKGR
jgi:uncharacterized protein with von Willebrand factor type A (vWA) domain